MSAAILPFVGRVLPISPADIEHMRATHQMVMELRHRRSLEREARSYLEFIIQHLIEIADDLDGDPDLKRGATARSHGAKAKGAVRGTCRLPRPTMMRTATHLPRSRTTTGWVTLMVVTSRWDDLFAALGIALDDTFAFASGRGRIGGETLGLDQVANLATCPIPAVLCLRVQLQIDRLAPRGL